MTISTCRTRLPIAIAVPPPHGVTVAFASAQTRNEAAIWSGIAGKHRSGGSRPSTLWTASRDVSLVTASVPSSPASDCASRSLLNCIRRRGFGLAIGTIEEIHEVIDFQPGSILLRSVTELKDAAGIGRDNDFGLSSATDCIFSFKRCCAMPGWLMF